MGLRDTGKPGTGVANGSPVVVVAMADWPNQPWLPDASAASQVVLAPVQARIKYSAFAPSAMLLMV